MNIEIIIDTSAERNIYLYPEVSGDFIISDLEKTNYNSEWLDVIVANTVNSMFRNHLEKEIEDAYERFYNP